MIKRPRLNKDIKPLSEFRANAAMFLMEIQDSGRPLVLTQRGHSTAVVLSAEIFESLMDELEALRSEDVVQRKAS